MRPFFPLYKQLYLYLINLKSLKIFSANFKWKLPICWDFWDLAWWLSFSWFCGYNFLHKYGVTRIGGGVGLCIDEYLNYKEHPDLVFLVDGSAESFLVEINRTKEKNVIVGIIYRPLYWKLNEFLSDLDLVLGKITN